MRRQHFVDSACSVVCRRTTVRLHPIDSGLSRNTARGRISDGYFLETYEWKGWPSVHIFGDLFGNKFYRRWALIGIGQAGNYNENLNLNWTQNWIMHCSLFTHIIEFNLRFLFSLTAVINMPPAIMSISLRRQFYLTFTGGVLGCSDWSRVWHCTHDPGVCLSCACVRTHRHKTGHHRQTALLLFQPNHVVDRVY